MVHFHIHEPKFYRLDSKQRGQYLLKRGDEERNNGRISKAIHYYEDAKEYGNSEAQHRLDQFSQIRFITGKPTSYTPIKPKAAPIVEEVPSIPQQIKLARPYFPDSHTPSNSKSLDPNPQDLKGYTVHNVPSTLALVQLFKISDEEQKGQIRSTISRIIDQFNEGLGSRESIQELAILATIPDQQILVAIITKLLNVEKSSSTFPELTIHGIAVILTSAPVEVDLSDREGLLMNILERLQYRLGNTRTENNNEELLPLLRAMSALFSAMLCRNFRHLARVDVYNPIVDQLTSIGSDSDLDHEVSFLAQYAIQSLAYIGNDESLAMSIYRRGRLAFGIIVDIKSMVFNFDPTVFESVYEKVVSMKDFTIKLEWYQGLLFVDCLLGNEELSRFEEFVIGSQLNTNEYFMRGVCLRLEQVASHLTSSISEGAKRFLVYIESNWPGGVQETARIALCRLGIPTGGSACVPTSTTVVRCRKHSSKNRLPPVWHKSWYINTQSNFLKSIQEADKLKSNISEMPEQIQDVKDTVSSVGDEMKKELSIMREELKAASSIVSADILEMQQALMDKYQPLLHIHRVSGDALGLEACYVNLAVVEASSQREKESDEMLKAARSFIRARSYENVSSTRTTEPIPIDNLLDKRKLLNEKVDVPKRILIIGRAGIGKTTFCKKLVHNFQGGHWNDRYDAVLWIQLRLLKDFKARDMEEMLLENYFTKGTKKERERLVQRFMESVKNGRVLFILDGLDEFVTENETDEGAPIRVFLSTLLSQTHVIITTRPYGNDRSLLHKLDLELETIGFSTDNVEEYVKRIIKNRDDAETVMKFIHDTPLIRGLVNIPIQLDLICFSWDDLVSNGSSTTISKLYQTIIQRLWCNDAVRMEKRINNMELTRIRVKELSPFLIRQSMAPVVDFLGYLAYSGLRNNHQIIFDQIALFKADEELRQLKRDNSQPDLPFELLSEVKKSSILHTADVSPGQVQTWNFIHLTFQEYFAAAWLSKYFQGEGPSSSVAASPDRESAIAFIQQHKYNPRYEIVWWMLAGLLEKEGLEPFFQLLQSEPRDLIDARHQLLLGGCYKESQSKIPTKLANHIENDLIRCLRFEATSNPNQRNGSVLAKQTIIPEEALFKCMELYPETQISITMALTYREYLSSFSVERVIKLTQSEDPIVVEHSMGALVQQAIVTELSMNAVAHVLQHHKLPRVRSIAANNLSKVPSLSEEICTVLLNSMLQEKNYQLVAMGASKALSKQDTLSESTLSAILAASRDEDARISSNADFILRKRHALPESTINEIVADLESELSDTRRGAAIILGSQSTLSESTEKALVACLQDYDEMTRKAAAKALSTQTTLSKSTVTAIIAALNNGNGDIKAILATTLGKQSTYSEASNTALITALQDDEYENRIDTVKALGSQTTPSESTIAAIVSALKDNHPRVRLAAVLELEKETTIPESAVDALLECLKDMDPDVRAAAASALGKHSMISESAIKTLFEYLNGDSLQPDKAEIIGKRQLKALKMGTEIFEGLEETVESGGMDPNDLIALAVIILGVQSTLLESTSTALEISLKSNYPLVRQAAVVALGNQSNLSETLVDALVVALQDETSDVRSAAIKSLGNQADLNEAAIKGLVHVLDDVEQSNVSSAIKVLSNQNPMSEFIVAALISHLGNETLLEDLSIALCKHSTFSKGNVKEIMGFLDSRHSSNFDDLIEKLLGSLEIYQILEELPESQLSTLYWRHLFPYSCDNLVSLYIHQGRLVFFTGQGNGQSEEVLSRDVIHRIESAFSKDLEKNKFIMRVKKVFAGLSCWNVSLS